VLIRAPQLEVHILSLKCCFWGIPGDSLEMRASGGVSAPSPTCSPEYIQGEHGEDERLVVYGERLGNRGAFKRLGYSSNMACRCTGPRRMDTATPFRPATPTPSRTRRLHGTVRWKAVDDLRRGLLTKGHLRLVAGGRQDHVP
jgi:hypothetical protein